MPSKEKFKLLNFLLLNLTLYFLEKGHKNKQDNMQQVFKSTQWG